MYNVDIVWTMTLKGVAPGEEEMVQYKSGKIKRCTPQVEGGGEISV